MSVPRASLPAPTSKTHTVRTGRRGRPGLWAHERCRCAGQFGLGRQVRGLPW